METGKTFLLLFSTLLSCSLAFFGTEDACTNVYGDGGNRQTLEFLYMTSFSSFLNSSGNAVGMLIALERINANTTVLADYNLTYSAIIDTQCNRTTSLTRFFDSINSPCRRFISIVGAGCTVASDPVAELLHYWGLTQISYLSNSGDFKDTRNFPQYIQLYPSEVNFAPALVAGVEHFGWKQVVIITQRESIFTTTEELITRQLEDEGISVVPSATIESSEDDLSNLPNLFPESGHIFFVNTYEDTARKILCEAFRRNLWGPNYAWMVAGWYDTEWWRVRDVDCSVAEMDTVIDRAVTIQQLPVNSDKDKKVVGNITFNEYEAEYAMKSREYFYNSVTTSHVNYDAMWALAFALDDADRRLKSNDLGNCSDLMVRDTLTTWNYSRNATASCLVYQALLQTEFEGLSGIVKFDENGTRRSVPVRFSQYRNGELVLFAQGIGASPSYEDSETMSTVFPNGVPPDGTPIQETTTDHPALIAIVYILALVGLALCVVSLVFITYYRDNLVLVLSTNVLNYCFILGIALIFLSFLFGPHPSTNPDFVVAACYLNLWLRFIGYITAFGAILVKLGRIYYVFAYPSKQKNIELSNFHLIGMVVFLVMIVVAILLVGTVIPVTRLSARLVEDLEYPSTVNDDGVLHEFMYYKCTSEPSIIWIVIMYLYMGLLQVAAIVLALQTRRVKIKGLNDTKSTIAMVFVSSIVTVVLLVVVAAFPDYQNTTEAVTNVVLAFGAYALLILMFAPKIILVYKNPDESKLAEHRKSLSRVELDKRGILKILNDNETIEALYKKVDELESAVEAKKLQMSTSPPSTIDRITENNILQDVIQGTHLKMVDDTTNAPPVDQPKASYQAEMRTVSSADEQQFDKLDHTTSCCTEV